MVRFRLSLIIGLCLCIINTSLTDYVEWAWIGGSEKKSEHGLHGEPGVASPDYIPRARWNSVGWFDSNTREAWLFGGFMDADWGNLNDVWRYRMNDSTWTWVSGNTTAKQYASYGEKRNASVYNVPGARDGAVGWFDGKRQEFWLFGGSGNTARQSGYLNDLWRYRMNDSTWTWISGSDLHNQIGFYGEKGKEHPDNEPCARWKAFGWYDSLREEFWLFGGDGHANTSATSGMLNDLWRYRVKNSTWTWISGSNTINLPGVYGEKGIASTDNYPGARHSAVGWFDSLRQEFWVFGGRGYDNSSDGLLNDLWRYRVNDSTWTWVSGSNTVDQFGVYGTLGIASTDNYPGARYGAVGWYDELREEFWLFGGYGNDAQREGEGNLNDLWRYRVNDNTWTWISGSNTSKQGGVYGEKGNVSTTNVPGARGNTVGWFDSSTQEFWLFGGHGYASLDEGGLNDLWRGSVIITTCPPLHQLINNTCVPLLRCSPSDNNNDLDTTTCSLQCNSMESDTDDSSCVIEGDMIVNGSIVETNTLTITGVINVTGNVVVADETKIKLSTQSVLHVGKCLVLEKGSEIVVVVESGMNSGGNVLLTFDESCSSTELVERVSFEKTTSFDECRDGSPRVQQETKDENGRAQLTLLFDPISESPECNGGTNINIVAIAIAVPIAVVVIVVVIVVMAVPKLRMKVFPFANRAK